MSESDSEPECNVGRRVVVRDGKVQEAQDKFECQSQSKQQSQRGQQSMSTKNEHFGEGHERRRRLKIRLPGRPHDEDSIGIEQNVISDLSQHSASTGVRQRGGGGGNVLEHELKNGSSDYKTAKPLSKSESIAAIITKIRSDLKEPAKKVLNFLWTLSERNPKIVKFWFTDRIAINEELQGSRLSAILNNILKQDISKLGINVNDVMFGENDLMRLIVTHAKNRSQSAGANNEQEILSELRPDKLAQFL